MDHEASLPRPRGCEREDVRRNQRQSLQPTYSYHHGYFDGVEREFRGFGRVEQTDTEEFGVLAPATNLDHAFHVPPTLTKTWFHTGAYFLSGERISRHFEDEYYREEGLSEAQAEGMLLDDAVLPAGIADAERREAVRS